MHQSRAGVILIVYSSKTPETPLFCLGKDALSNDFTDFGGKLCKLDNGNPLKCALREFEEESLGVFGEFGMNDVLEDYCVYSDTSLIVFIKIRVENTEWIDLQFSRKLKYQAFREIIKLKWLTLDKLNEAVNKNKIYYKPRVILKYILKEDKVNLISNSTYTSITQ